MPDHETYLSPFSWRYASDDMRRLWSEVHKRRLWRLIWVELAEVQAEYGLVRPEQLEDLRAHCGSVDVPRALQIEAEIHHDLMAELQAYAEQARLGGAFLHLGATSMDIEDNADALRLLSPDSSKYYFYGELRKSGRKNGKTFSPRARMCSFFQRFNLNYIERPGIC